MTIEDNIEDFFPVKLLTFEKISLKIKIAIIEII